MVHPKDSFLYSTYWRDSFKSYFRQSTERELFLSPALNQISWEGFPPEPIHLFIEQIFTNQRFGSIQWKRQARHSHEAGVGDRQ